MTLPWTRMRHPKAADLEIRERVLGWVSGYVDDPEWFIQKAIGWWLATCRATIRTGRGLFWTRMAIG